MKKVKENKLKKYGIPFDKTVYGMFIVYAKSKKDAQKKFDASPGNFEEYENKSSYNMEGEIEEMNE